MKYIILILIFISSSLYASIGKITAIKGDATVVRGTQNLTPKIGFLVEQNDNIITKNNTRLQLVFKDKTIISLGKNTNFSIKEYFFDEAQPKKISAKFKVAGGVFKAITGRIGKINPKKFTLKTKSASIGIRGTIFFGESQNKGAENISCTQGKIEVRTPQGVVEVKAGEMTRVEVGKPPAPPVPLPKAKKEALEKDSGAKENEQESGQDEKVAKKAKSKPIVKEAKGKQKKEVVTKSNKETKKIVTNNEEPTQKGTPTPDTITLDDTPEVDDAIGVDDVVDNIIDNTTDVINTATEAKDDILEAKVNDTLKEVAVPAVEYSGFYADWSMGLPLYITTSGDSLSGYLGFEGGTYTYHDSDGNPFEGAATYIPFSGTIGSPTPFSGTLVESVYKDSDGETHIYSATVNGTFNPKANTLSGYASWGTVASKVYWEESDYTDTINGTYIIANASEKVEDINEWVSTLAEEDKTATYQGAISGYLNNVTFIDPTTSWLSLTLNFSSNLADAAFHINGNANWVTVSGATMSIYSDDYTVYSNSASSAYSTNSGYINIRGSLYNNGDNNIGSFYAYNGIESASGIFDLSAPTTKATKSVEYYSIHSASGDMEFETDSDGNKIWVNGISEHSYYKVRDGYNSSYSMANGVLTVDDVLTKFIYDSSSNSYVEDGTTDYSFTIDLSDNITTPTYIGFKNVKVLEDPDEPNLEGAVFADSKGEFTVLSLESDSYYLSDGTPLTKISDNEYEDSDGNSYTWDDVAVKYEYERSRIYGEKTSWDTVKDLTGVSQYFDPDRTSSLGAINPKDNYQDTDHVLYTTNSTLVNWDNKTLIHYDMETYNTFVFIGNISEDSNGDAAINFKTFDSEVSNDNLYATTSDSSEAGEGYIFGSEYQGLGVNVVETYDDYTQSWTAGEFRDPVAETATTNYDGKTATGFANAFTSIGNDLTFDFTSTGFTGTIDTDASSLITFGGDYANVDSALVSKDLFAALNFAGQYTSNDYNVTGGSILAIDFGTVAEDDISWGIWAVDTDSTDANSKLGRDFWVASVSERVEDISQWANDNNITTASYSGAAMGWTSTNEFINPTTSHIDFTLDFSDNTIDGALNVNGSDFASFTDGSLSVDGAVFNGSASSDDHVITGSLYNNGASSIGSFKFTNSNNDIATGVFSTVKQ